MQFNVSHRIFNFVVMFYDKFVQHGVVFGALTNVEYLARQLTMDHNYSTSCNCIKIKCDTKSVSLLFIENMLV